MRNPRRLAGVCCRFLNTKPLPIGRGGKDDEDEVVLAGMHGSDIWILTVAGYFANSRYDQSQLLAPQSFQKLLCKRIKCFDPADIAQIKPSRARHYTRVTTGISNT
jgi:hypothetical protein